MSDRRRLRPVAVALLAGVAFAGAAPAADPPASPSAHSGGLVTLEPGALHSGIAARPDPTQTYDLYLPSDFDAQRKWPLLMVFDPRSRGALAAEIFRPAAERWGWIVASSNNTLSDAPTFDMNIRAVNAMWPDLMERLPIDERRVYATGFSGGAILAWIVGQQTGRLAGVISVGGRPVEGLEHDPPRFASWLAAGRTDFNHTPTLELEELAARSDRLHRFEVFEGPHSWFSAEEAERAVAWLEIVAMHEGRRPVDAELARAELARDLAGADALLAAGDALAAQRRLTAIAATWEGLADVESVAVRARKLAKDPRVKKALDDEKWGARYEEAVRRRLATAMADLSDTESMLSPARFRARLNVPALLAAAEENGLRGDAGRRGIAIVHTQLAFYLMRDLFAAGEHARAVPALEVAVELQPENATTWYNLACARARSHQTDDALAALERAIDLGLPAWMRPADQDPDLESLRDRPEFVRLVARARGGSPAGSGPAPPARPRRDPG